jgi:hypothetical protein
MGWRVMTNGPHSDWSARAVEVSQSRLKIREVLCPRPLSTAGPATKNSLTLKPQILKMHLDGHISSSAFKGFSFRLSRSVPLHHYSSLRSSPGII